MTGLKTSDIRQWRAMNPEKEVRNQMRLWTSLDGEKFQATGQRRDIQVEGPLPQVSVECQPMCTCATPQERNWKRLERNTVSSHRARNSACSCQTVEIFIIHLVWSKEFSQEFCLNDRDKIRPKCLIERIFMLNLGEKYVQYVSEILKVTSIFIWIMYAEIYILYKKILNKLDSRFPIKWAVNLIKFT